MTAASSDSPGLTPPPGSDAPIKRIKVKRMPSGYSRIAVAWPNGLPFSRRKRCTDCQNSEDLGRAAVGWNGGLGGLATDARLLLAYAHHTSTKPRQHDGSG